MMIPPASLTQRGGGSAPLLESLRPADYRVEGVAVDRGKRRMGKMRIAVIAAIAGAAFARPSLAFDLVCSSVCEDKNPNSTCMSYCAAGNAGSSSGGGAPARQYGAIAISPSTLLYGHSFRFASRKQAEEAAMTYCFSNKGNPRDCKVTLWFYDTCASLAIKQRGPGENGAWGAQWANSRESAKKKAIDACKTIAGTGCKTELTTCSGR